MRAHRRIRLRCAGILGPALFLLAVAASPSFQGLSALPEHVRIVRGDDREISRRLPMHLYVRPDRSDVILINGKPVSNGRWYRVDRGKLSLQSMETGKYQLQMRLFGILPIRSVTMDVLPRVSLVPGGESIGVNIRSPGVLVADDAEVIGEDGRRRYPAREADIEAGDLIVAINGKRIKDKEEAAQLIAESGRRGETVRVQLLRNGRVMTREIRPVYDEARQRFLIGLWIRDWATGIGTLSFYDPSTNTFGALGHMVTDNAGRPYPMDTGTIVEAFVAGIRPGRPGEPGEKIGVFVDEGTPLGLVTTNTPFGIFGRLDKEPATIAAKAPVPVGLAGEVRRGPAQMLTVVKGRQVEAFDVEIERVAPQDRADDKGMTIRVTDPRLLAATGGIVQGMSGSPILQDGKLVGAVTHVFVNDPTRGYAVFAEWMAGNLPRADGREKVTRRAAAIVAIH